MSPQELYCSTIMKSIWQFNFENEVYFMDFCGLEMFYN